MPTMDEKTVTLDEIAASRAEIDASYRKPRLRIHVPRKRSWLTPSHEDQVLAAIKHCGQATMIDIAVTVTGQPYGVWAITNKGTIDEPSTRLRRIVHKLASQKKVSLLGKYYKNCT